MKRRKFLQNLGAIGLLLGLDGKDYTKVDRCTLKKLAECNDDPRETEPGVRTVIKKPGGHVEFNTDTHPESGMLSSFCVFSPHRVGSFSA